MEMIGGWLKEWCVRQSLCSESEGFGDPTMVRMIVGLVIRQW